MARCVLNCTIWCPTGCASDFCYVICRDSHLVAGVSSLCPPGPAICSAVVWRKAGDFGQVGGCQMLPGVGLLRGRAAQNAAPPRWWEAENSWDLERWVVSHSRNTATNSNLLLVVHMSNQSRMMQRIKSSMSAGVVQFLAVSFPTAMAWWLTNWYLEAGIWWNFGSQFLNLKIPTRVVSRTHLCILYQQHRLQRWNSDGTWPYGLGLCCDSAFLPPGNWIGVPLAAASDVTGPLSADIYPSTRIGVWWITLIIFDLSVWWSFMMMNHSNDECSQFSC